MVTAVDRRNEGGPLVPQCHHSLSLTHGWMLPNMMIVLLTNISLYRPGKVRESARRDIFFGTRLASLINLSIRYPSAVLWYC